MEFLTNFILDLLSILDIKNPYAVLLIYTVLSALLIETHFFLRKLLRRLFNKILEKLHMENDENDEIE